MASASCTLAVISEKGRKLKDFPVETNGQALVEAIRMIPGHKHLVIEEGLQSAWLYETLNPLLQVPIKHVANAGFEVRAGSDVVAQFLVAFVFDVVSRPFRQSIPIRIAGSRKIQPVLRHCSRKTFVRIVGG